MWVATGRIVLDFYNNDDVALKKRQLVDLSKTLRKKFNLSALEVDDFDDPEKCVLGFSAVLPANWPEPKSKQWIQSVMKELDENSFARVSVQNTDLFSIE